MKSLVVLSIASVAALTLAGCRGVTASGETQARHDVAAVTGQYRPQNRPAPLPALTADSTLSNLVEYAVLNSPTVEAAFNDWSASVENITITRSLPDPQLTFQAYIQDVITSLMPGFAWSFPGPGKLAARAGVATAESREKYFTFASAVLQAAMNLKRAYYQLGLLDEQRRLKNQMCALWANQGTVFHAQSVTGTAALSESLRVQSELDRTRSELAGLEDSRLPALANFKAALGLGPDQPDPPTPQHFESADEIVDANQLSKAAFVHNPQLAAMAAEVRVAEAGIAVAYKERVPDFSVALMADVKASPVLFWPQSSVSLPIWHDKLAAEMAQAEANTLAAKSRWKAAQIELAVNFAEKLFTCRETARNVALIENRLIPQASQSLAIVQADYRTGTANFSGVTAAEQTLLDLRLQAAEARADDEIAVADLTLTIAGIPPPSVPFLANAHQP
jgi:outer membrane protein TolC